MHLKRGSRRDAIRVSQSEFFDLTSPECQPCARGRTFCGCLKHLSERCARSCVPRQEATKARYVNVVSAVVGVVIGAPAVTFAIECYGRAKVWTSKRRRSGHRRMSRTAKNGNNRSISHQTRLTNKRLRGRTHHPSLHRGVERPPGVPQLGG